MIHYLNSSVTISLYIWSVFLQEPGCSDLCDADRPLTFCRERQPGNLPQHIPGQPGLSGEPVQGDLTAGTGLHHQVTGQRARVSFVK